MTILEEIQKRLNDLPLEKQREALDFIAFLQEQTRKARSTEAQSEKRKRIKDAFAALAAARAFEEIADPLAWQKQIRQDRPLPGRAG